jgi:hypothetical protein
MKMPFIITIFLCSLSLFAQKPVRDVVYLNNGSIIRGNIIEISENKTLKIESCENILVFDMTDVHKITKEVHTYLKDDHDFAKPSGYINITSFGVLAGPAENSSMAPVSIETINGYRLNNKYTFGLGIGMDIFEKIHVPVFLDGRYMLLNRDISPVIIIKGGYSLPVGRESTNNFYYNEYYSKGGPMLGTGAGLVFRINNHNLVSISLLYRYQQLITTEVQRNGDRTWKFDHSVKYNRMELKFGFYFD